MGLETPLFHPWKGRIVTQIKREKDRERNKMIDSEKGEKQEI